MGMLDVDGDGDDGDDGDDGPNDNDNGSNGNEPIRATDVFPILDNVLWRTMGVGLDSLPAGDRQSIERAVREVVR